MTRIIWAIPYCNIIWGIQVEFRVKLLIFEKKTRNQNISQNDRMTKKFQKIHKNWSKQGKNCDFCQKYSKYDVIFTQKNVIFAQKWGFMNQNWSLHEIFQGLKIVEYILDMTRCIIWT